MSEFFPDVPKIAYGGPKSRNPLEFKHYNPDEVVGGKTLKEHLRFSVVYWHTFSNPLSDPFGVGHGGPPLGRRQPTRSPTPSGRPGPRSSSSRSSAPRSTPSTTATSPPRAKTLKESHANLDEVVKVLKEEQARTGIKLLWGTANLFTNPRYMHGAATSPNLDVFAYAAAQVKKAMEVTHELGGAGYTFWGGREGYSTLLNTDMKRELDHLARFLHMAVDYKKQIGFTGHVLHRAQAEGADQAPVRLRRRGLPELPADLRPARPLQAQPRDQPRDPGRPRDDARAGGRHRRRAPSARSTPTPATRCSAGTPTSSRRTST